MLFCTYTMTDQFSSDVIFVTVLLVLSLTAMDWFSYNNTCPCLISHFCRQGQVQFRCRDISHYDVILHFYCHEPV